MMQTGHTKLKYEDINVRLILQEVKNILDGEKLKENKTHIDIILNADNRIDEPAIFTDSRKLKQVLINLLKNSLKFTNEGNIEFGFSETKTNGNNFLKFYVKDNGIGIDKEFHSVIFNIFRQVDDTHTRKLGGTGIGLSIAKKIVELLGGEIWVESELGKGSIFYFTIPAGIKKNLTDTTSPDTIKVTAKKYSGNTILIAEDDTSSFEFLKIYFKPMQINVLWAKNGNEAVELCKNNPTINLVLMDLKMPDLNGFEATRLIKDINPSLPVVAQSAYAMNSEREKAFSYGCDDYLNKPIKIIRLMEILNKYLRS